MKQPIPTFSSISELVEHHGGNIARGNMGRTATGIIVMLKGVSIVKGDGSLQYFLSDGKNEIHCFGDGIEPHGSVDVTGTYHGEFFKVYQIN